jgi:type IV pilus assembly protein PilQ
LALRCLKACVVALDVTDFATPVKSIDSYNEGNDGMMVIQPQGEFEYLAYQTDNKLTISVKPVST